MKTIHILFLLLLSTTVSLSQATKEQNVKQLISLYGDLYEEAKEKKNKYSNKPCYKNAGKIELTVDEILPSKEFTSELMDFMIGELVPPDIYYDIELGLYASKMDKALAALGDSDSFLAFVFNYTGLSHSDHSKNDIRDLRSYYNSMNRIKTSSHLSSFIYELTKGTCKYSYYYFIERLKSKLPSVKYEIEINVNKSCKCFKDNNEESVDFETVVYKGFISGRVGSNSFTFSSVTDPEKELFSLNCCKAKKPEQISSEPVAQVELPEQYIGGTAGVGFEQDFDETSICLGVEYGYKFAQSEKGTGFYVGGEAALSTTNFMDFSNTMVHVGPQVQSWCPITPSKEVHWVNEIEGAYVLGSKENNGFKDDINGFNIGLNTGVNIALSDSWAVGIEIPIVSYQNLTFESKNNGTELKVDDTIVFLNKNNPATISIRYNLDR
ncbi:MAG: hypothetical protein AAF688_08465 [Bacteroidota bacterium]